MMISAAPLLQDSDAYSSFLKECFSSSFPVRESCISQIRYVHKSGPSKHHGLEEQQADPPRLSGSIIDNLQEFVKLNQWHVGMNVFEVALQERVPCRLVRYGQSAFCEQVVNVYGCHPLWQRL